MATTTNELTMAHALATYSGFVSSMMGVGFAGDASSWGAGLGGFDGITQVMVKVKITKKDANKVDVWDQVEIDGVWCGNRCGGRDELARRFAPVFAQIGARDAARAAGLKRVA